MKKFGFTLAEILITMGIIGVVAALTAPTLVNNAANAQIRPTLAKAVETLENANLDLINRQELNSLRDLGAIANADGTLNAAYINGIIGVMSGAVGVTAAQDIANENAPNNTLAIIHMKGNIDLNFVSRDGQPDYVAQGGLRGPYCDLIIDIDGNGNNDNNGGQLGNDLYRFVVDGSGTVLPYGGRALFSANNGFGHWNGNVSEVNNCENVDDAIADGINCAGAVFEDTQINFR